MLYTIKTAVSVIRKDAINSTDRVVLAKLTIPQLLKKFIVFFAPVQIGPGAQPTSCTMVTGVFLVVKPPGSGGERTSLLAPRLRMARATRLLPLCAFMACYRVNPDSGNLLAFYPNLGHYCSCQPRSWSTIYYYSYHLKPHRPRNWEGVVK